MNYAELRRMRARHIAVVFQAAMSGFNPVITIGEQVEHILHAHPDVYTDKGEGRKYFEELLKLVRLRPLRFADAGGRCGSCRAGREAAGRRRHHPQLPAGAGYTGH